MRGWDAMHPTGQQEAPPLLQRHVPEGLGKDGMSLNRQGHCPSVLAEFVGGDAGIPAGIFRLVNGGQQTEKSSSCETFMMFELPQIWSFSKDKQLLSISLVHWLL